MGRVRWIVGDVHGCIEPFGRLLAAIRFDESRDSIWCAGDLVHGGPDSAEVLRLFRSVGGRGVLGNHDLYAIEVASGWRRRRDDTLDDLLAAPDVSELLAFLGTLTFHAVFPRAAPERDVLLVHAGLDPRWTDPRATLEAIDAGSKNRELLASDPVRCVTTIRCCTADGTRPRHAGPPDACPPGSLPWDSFYRGGDFVVHGHWARRGLHRGPRVLGLDSGCVYGGRLTAWCLEEDRLVDVRGQVLK